MAIVVGVHPGGRNSFAITALYWTGHLPAMVIGSRTYSGVDSVLNDIIGVFGEWGELSNAVIDAPLTWCGSPNGWRESDQRLREMIPSWAPRSWHRSSNALPGSTGIQGPALTWSLALETKRGTLPKHEVFESHPRIALGRVFRDLGDVILAYRKREVPKAERKKHIDTIVTRFVDAGVVKFETDPPSREQEIDSLVCGITGIGAGFPESGLVTHQLPGGNIRPVGKRSIVMLDALP